MNKREFMLAAGAAGVAGAAWSAAPPLRVQGWRARVGQGFEADRAAKHLVLLRCLEYAGQPELQQYTLVFRSGRAAPPAGLYTLHGNDGLRHALYLEPAGRAADGSALLRADCCHLG